MSLFLGQPPDPVNDDKGATFNADRTHRYRCWRTWDADLPPLAWLMLNPSTADERVLDPTLKRVRAFSIAWGFGGFEVWNLWSLRSTDPKGLWARLRERDQQAPFRTLQEPFNANVIAILAELPRFRDAVCAWGDFSGCPTSMRPMAENVAGAIASTVAPDGMNLWCLGRTKSGQPIHPLARGKHRVPDGAPRLPYELRPTASSEP